MTTTSAPADLELLRSALVEQAEEATSEYPQYRGHWNSWKVGRIVRNLQWRGYEGAQFRMAHEGEYVLVDPSPRDRWSSAGTVTVYLPNSPVGSGRGMNTSIYSSEVEVMS